MRKIFFTSFLFTSWLLATNAQSYLSLLFSNKYVQSPKSSVSINYLYLGGREKRAADAYEGTIHYFDKVSKSLASNGIGIQGKIQMRGDLIIMPDIGYFFEEYEKVTVEANHLKDAYRENKLSCLAANINIGYNILQMEPFSLVFLAGAGYFRENIWSYCFSKGEMKQDDPTFIPTHDINEEIEKSINAFVLNMGIIGEVYLTKNIFANVGLKFMFDLGDRRFNGFPYLNAGVGFAIW